MAPITLYSTTYCGFCRAAKQLLIDRNLPFTEIDLSEDDALRREISAKAGHYKTVPMIFVGDRFIGGYSELRALADGGKL